MSFIPLPVVAVKLVAAPKFLRFVWNEQLPKVPAITSLRFRLRPDILMVAFRR